MESRYSLLQIILFGFEFGFVMFCNALYVLLSRIWTTCARPLTNRCMTSDFAAVFPQVHKLTQNPKIQDCGETSAIAFLNKDIYDVTQVCQPRVHANGVQGMWYFASRPLPRNSEVKDVGFKVKVYLHHACIGVCKLPGSGCGQIFAAC